jgi:hypothetical protein
MAASTYIKRQSPIRRGPITPRAHAHVAHVGEGFFCGRSAMPDHPDCKGKPR